MLLLLLVLHSNMSGHCMGKKTSFTPPGEQCLSKYESAVHQFRYMLAIMEVVVAVAAAVVVVAELGGGVR